MIDTKSKNWIVIYDICEPKRLQRVAKVCEKYGFRAQKSVFEVYSSEGHIRLLKKELKNVINEKEDSLIIISICEKDWQKQLKYGLDSEYKEDEGSFCIL